MKRKMLLCVLLALVLPLFTQPAAALLSNQRATIVEAVTRLPVINVIVPSSVDVMINPLQMPVQVNGEEVRDQIICQPSFIANASDAALKVDITVTGAVAQKSDMQLVSSSTGGTGTAKNAFIYFEIMQATESQVENERVPWEPAYDASKHLVVKDGVAAAKQNVVTLPPMTKDYEIAKNGYAAFRLAGDAAKDPATPWNTNDGINVTVAFTFTPLSYDEW